MSPGGSPGTNQRVQQTTITMDPTWVTFRIHCFLIGKSQLRHKALRSIIFHIRKRFHFVTHGLSSKKRNKEEVLGTNPRPSQKPSSATARRITLFFLRISIFRLTSGGDTVIYSP